MFDTHVNLHSDAFAEDLAEVLARARVAGVRRFLAICDRLDHFQAVRAIAEENADIWCSVGVHPHHSKDFPDLAAQDLIALANDPKVVAIGETGLDFHHNYSPQDAQCASLEAHITASQATGLPLILHARDGDDLMGDVLERRYAQAAFTPLLHCYTGGARLAERALALGAYFSVSGILSFKNAHAVRAVIAELPLDRIVLETDCPYLAPVPHRGRRNEPAYLPDVARALGALHNMTAEEVAQQTEANALRLFERAL